MKMNKKAMTWQQIVLAILAIVVVTFVIIWFQKGGEGVFGTLSDKIGGLKDCDGDNVADMFDKCPCEATVEENKKSPGCPSNVEPKNAKKLGVCTCVKKEEKSGK